MVSRSETFSINSMMSTQSSTVNGEKKKQSGLKALYKKLKPGGSKSKEQDSTAELDTLREELSVVEEERQKMQRELSEATLLREQLQTPLRLQDVAPAWQPGAGLLAGLTGQLELELQMWWP